MSAKTDEFVVPTVVTNEKGSSATVERECNIFFNFRPDRAGQLAMLL